MQELKFELRFGARCGTFGVVNNKPVSARDAFAQVSARRNAENPWTAADEARASAKRAAEQAAQDKWAAANPQQDDEQDDEEVAS